MGKSYLKYVKFSFNKFEIIKIGIFAWFIASCIETAKIYEMKKVDSLNTERIKINISDVPNFEIKNAAVVIYDHMFATIGILDVPYFYCSIGMPQIVAHLDKNDFWEYSLIDNKKELEKLSTTSWVPKLKNMNVDNNVSTYYEFNLKQYLARLMWNFDYIVPVFGCYKFEGDSNIYKKHFIGHIKIVKKEIFSLDDMIRFVSTKNRDINDKGSIFELKKKDIEKFIYDNPTSGAINFSIKFGDKLHNHVENCKLITLLGEGEDGDIYLCEREHGERCVLKFYRQRYESEEDLNKSPFLPIRELNVRNYLEKNGYPDNFVKLLFSGFQFCQKRAVLVMEQADMLLVEFLNNITKYVDDLNLSEQWKLLNEEMKLFSIICMEDFENYGNILVTKEKDGFYHIKVIDFVMTTMNESTPNYFNIMMFSERKN